MGLVQEPRGQKFESELSTIELMSAEADKGCKNEFKHKRQKLEKDIDMLDKAIRNGEMLLFFI